MSCRKKLIEVALPLAEINDASAYDKMPGIGAHPKGIHHWWARLPLPTARAVLFASVVDDPSSQPERFPTEEMQNAERERLFEILRRLMQKKMHEHPEVYAEAKAEMLKHCGGELPPVLDPFAGGGSIPLEAARLGFEAHAADLNPVAVLLNKCCLELIPRWADQPPVNPEDRSQETGGRRLTAAGWRGSSGLAEDVRCYGRIIRERAMAKIGHLYPQVRIVQERDGSWRHATDEEIRSGKPGVREASVIARLWARTVASPNPAARGAHVPLMSTFWLSSKKGSEAWLEPVVDNAAGTWRFRVRTGAPKDREAVKAGTKAGRALFRCLLTGVPIHDDHIKAQGKAGRMGAHGGHRSRPRPGPRVPPSNGGARGRRPEGRAGVDSGHGDPRNYTVFGRKAVRHGPFLAALHRPAAHGDGDALGPGKGGPGGCRAGCVGRGPHQGRSRSLRRHGGDVPGPGPGPLRG